jgi:hypothetical protein
MKFTVAPLPVDTAALVLVIVPLKLHDDGSYSLPSHVQHVNETLVLPPAVPLTEVGSTVMYGFS